MFLGMESNHLPVSPAVVEEPPSWNSGATFQIKTEVFVVGCLLPALRFINRFMYHDFEPHRWWAD